MDGVWVLFLFFLSFKFFFPSPFYFLLSCLSMPLIYRCRGGERGG